jgi:hypothetical protein
MNELKREKKSENYENLFIQNKFVSHLAFFFLFIALIASFKKESR